MEREARQLWQAGTEARLGRKDADDDIRDGSINRLVLADTGLSEDIQRETGKRVADVLVLTEALRAEELRAQAAETKLDRLARDAGTAAAAAQSHGPLFEVGGVGGLIGRARMVPVDQDGNPPGADPIRGMAVGGGGFELRAGVDARNFQLAGFGQFQLGADGFGHGPDTALMVGADMVGEFAPVEFGGWLAYLHTEDRVSYLDLSVKEDGVVGGLTIQGDLDDGIGRLVPFLRLGAGVGYHGTRGVTTDGRPSVVSFYGPLVVLQGGLRFGAGALR